MNNNGFSWCFLLIGLIAVSTPCHAFARWGPPLPSSRNNALNTERSASTLASGDSVNTLNGSSDNADEVFNADGNGNVKTQDILSLDSIRSTLIRQEETIIFALIERAQYRRNSITYEKGGFGDLGIPGFGSNGSLDDEQLSFFEWMLISTEAVHSSARRYTSPEEHAFFPDRLPEHGKGLLEKLPKLEYPTNLLSPVGDACEVNFNEILLKKYLDVVVPKISKKGDDEQHGSTVLADIAALQALSKRVHYGKFVAESKYQSDPEEYQKLVDANDADGVMELLTNAKVEKQVLRRARLKAATYGREPLLSSLPQMGESGDDSSTPIVAAAAAAAVVAAIEAMDNEEHNDTKIDPCVIEDIYRDIIIPLTKDIEVAYLFKRCGRQPPKEYQPDRMSIDVKNGLFQEEDN